MKNLHPYIWWPHSDGDWAMLVFDYTAERAKRTGFKDNPITGGVDWTDIRVKKLEETPHIMAQMRSDKPHAIDDPVTCTNCEYAWSSEPTCEKCEADW